MSKPAACAIKEFMKVLYELGAFSSNVVDVEKALNGKRFVSDLTEKAKKKTGAHILKVH